MRTDISKLDLLDSIRSKVQIEELQAIQVNAEWPDFFCTLGMLFPQQQAKSVEALGNSIVDSYSLERWSFLLQIRLSF